MAQTVHEIEDKAFLETLREDAAAAALELTEKAGLKAGQLVVVGCSTSETLGRRVGSWSVPEAGEAIYEGLMSVFAPRGIFVAAQCCEHLNRALIVEADAPVREDPVNVVPQPKAGGSFATAAYHRMKRPMAVEHVRADAGLDIGGTLIGMHLREVAVPLRLEHHRIGQAPVLAARTRPKFIGGDRAIYDENLKAGYPAL